MTELWGNSQKDPVYGYLENPRELLFIDMDGVLVQIDDDKKDWEKNRIKKGFFLSKQPVKGAVEAFHFLSNKCQLYILSTPVWDNPYCWMEKRIWVEKFLSESACKKLILSHNKALNKGNILIDDSFSHGVREFNGLHIHFGSIEYPDWDTVLSKFEF